jgi:hypothetical protein
VLVNINVNRFENGRVQIQVAKPQGSPILVQIYPSTKAARRVLLEFGLDEKDVDATLKLLLEVGPNEPLTFSGRNVPQNILWKHGFKVA